MPARLVALDDDHQILIDRPILLIGRHEECDIQLESSKISRRHCCIAQVDQSYLVVRDLDSTNGVRINNEPVSEGKLRPGDELTLGNVRYQLKWDEAEDLGHATARPPGGRDAPLLGELVLPDGDARPVADNMLSCEIPMPIKEPGVPLRVARPAPPDKHQTAPVDEPDEAS